VAVYCAPSIGPQPCLADAGKASRRSETLAVNGGGFCGLSHELYDDNFSFQWLTPDHDHEGAFRERYTFDSFKRGYNCSC